MTETDLVTANDSAEQAELPNTVNTEFSSPATPDVTHRPAAAADPAPIADADPAPKAAATGPKRTGTQGGRNDGRLEGVAVEHGAA